MSEAFWEPLPQATLLPTTESAVAAPPRLRRWPRRRLTPPRPLRAIDSFAPSRPVPGGTDSAEIAG